MRALLALAVLASSAFVAHASPVGADGISVNEVRAVMRGMGLSPTDSPQNDGAPGLAASFGGVNYDVAFHECDPRGNCLSLQIYAGFTLDSAAATNLMNSWNQQWRYAYASVDDNGAAFIQLDFDMKHGSTEQVQSNIERFHDLAPRFSQFIGYTAASGGNTGGK